MRSLFANTAVRRVQCARLTKKAAPGVRLGSLSASAWVLCTLRSAPPLTVARSLNTQWFGFHFDRASFTVNIALSSDGSHGGGDLLAVVAGRLQRCERSEGTATMHASTLLHGVTRMTRGERYALVMFYREVCPQAKHALVHLDAETMAAVYPAHAGGYHCDVCGDDAEELGWPGMWHCAEGCEFDMCRVCYDSYDVECVAG